MTPKSKISKRS